MDVEDFPELSRTWRMCLPRIGGLPDSGGQSETQALHGIDLSCAPLFQSIDVLPFWVKAWPCCLAIFSKSMQRGLTLVDEPVSLLIFATEKID